MVRSCSVGKAGPSARRLLLGKCGVRQAAACRGKVGCGPEPLGRWMGRSGWDRPPVVSASRCASGPAGALSNTRPAPALICVTSRHRLSKHSPTEPANAELQLPSGRPLPRPARAASRPGVRSRAQAEQRPRGLARLPGSAPTCTTPTTAARSRPRSAGSRMACGREAAIRAGRRGG